MALWKGYPYVVVYVVKSLVTVLQTNFPKGNKKHIFSSIFRRLPAKAGERTKTESERVTLRSHK